MVQVMKMPGKLQMDDLLIVIYTICNPCDAEIYEMQMAGI